MRPHKAPQSIGGSLVPVGRRQRSGYEHALAFSPPAPHAGVDTSAQDEAQVRAAAEEWRKAIGARNLDVILGYYAPDAWTVTLDGTVVMTEAGRREFWQSIASMPMVTDTVDVADKIELSMSGELAVQYGQFRQVYADRKGATTSVPQSFMTTWRRMADGSWKVTANMSTVRQEVMIAARQK
jgi:uncharacterized protein (TIGR02246 family)